MALNITTNHLTKSTSNNVNGGCGQLGQIKFTLLNSTEYTYSFDPANFLHWHPKNTNLHFNYGVLCKSKANISELNRRLALLSPGPLLRISPGSGGRISGGVGMPEKRGAD
ncbi:hypothetical protein ACN38_g1371 [Penicillium nordicum]|uniref:Uncharacterized protein n=1 Tax=Penicillium nordicum TaxID=229535 RepID=A0A0M8PBR2_9EURO|nr:hypothetical protein ACN38_g1371 [Penicillium nordicum]